MTMTAMATQNLLDDPAFVTLFTTIVAVRLYDHRRAQAAADASAH